MPQIPNFLNTQNSVPLQETPAINENQAKADYSQSLDTYSQLINTQLQQYQRVAYQSDRANLMATEAQHQAAMNLPESMNKIQQLQLHGIQVDASINEMQKEKEQKANDASWMANAQMNLQSSYLTFQDQAKQSMAPDGSGYHQQIQQFVNSQIEAGAKSAPSQNALIDWVDKTNSFARQALDQSFSTEMLQRQNYRVGQVNSAASSLVNQVRQDPGNMDSYLKQLPDITSALGQTGYGKNEIDTVNSQFTSQIYGAQIKGLLDKKDGPNTDSALALLGSPDAENNIGTKQYQQLVSQAGAQKSFLLTHHAKDATLAANTLLFQGHMVDPSDPGMNAASDQSFKQNLGETVDNSVNASQKDVSSIASTVGTYFRQQPELLGTKTKSQLDNILTMSQNPYQVAGIALGMSDTLNDPNQKAQRIFNSLDPKSQALVGRMSSLIDANVPIESAFATARSDINKSENNPNQELVKKTLQGFGADEANSIVRSQFSGILGSGVGLTLNKPSLGVGLGIIGVNGRPDVPTDVTADAYNIAKGYLQQYGDINIARTLTQGVIASKYGRTEINGSQEIMAHAPEMVYNQSDLEQFKNKWDAARTDIFNRLKLTPQTSLFGGKETPFVGVQADNPGTPAVKLALQAIPNRGSPSDPYSVQYQVINSNTGMPIMAKNPETGNMEFNIMSLSRDESMYNNLRAATLQANEIHAGQRSSYLSQALNKVNEYTNGLLQKSQSANKTPDTTTPENGGS